MLQTDSDARVDALTGDLRQRLTSAWPLVEFTLGLDAALLRPGAEIDVVWADGPPAEDVATHLAPRWTASANEAGYPVTLHRELSAAGCAQAVVTLHACGELQPLIDCGREAFERSLPSVLANRIVPDALGDDVRARAALLIELSGGGSSTGREWFDWLRGGGLDLLDSAVTDALCGPIEGSMTV